MRNYFLTSIPNNPKYVLLIGIFIICCGGANVLAQSVRDTDYKADRNLKSNARINPSTLAMELSVPLMDYPGRGGNSIPLTFNYSSKVWTMRQSDFARIDVGGEGTQQNPYLVSFITAFQPEYSERAVAGWTSNLQPISEMWDNQFFQVDRGDGQLIDLQVRRVMIRMPDGSTHEFRKDDNVFNCSEIPFEQCADISGTYLSVDGSGMRLIVEGQPGNYQRVLYLPDGGRYILNISGQQYIDRNGNKTIYDATARRLTDTLGREITEPLPSSFYPGVSVGTIVFQLPGINGQNRTYTQKWQKLKPDGCIAGTEPSCQDAGLENPTDQLYYVGTDTCQNIPMSNTDYPVSPSLFTVDPSYTVPRVESSGYNNIYYSETFKQRACGGGLFNPIVQTEINLPNGTKYQFKYNRYGEMTKIIYPTGGYERFRYDVIVSLANFQFPYSQTNRGVVERWISTDGVTETQNWRYGSEFRTIAGQPSGNVITTIAPDNTKTERIVYAGGSWLGFEDPRAGRPFEEKVYSQPATLGNEQSRTLLRRELSDWIVAPPRSGGNGQWGGRDARPAKTISIIFEQGASQALARMTETIYDTHSDPEYFAQLNPKQVKTYSYIVLDLTTAQTAGIDQIATFFTSSNLATVAEMDYLYDANYKARNITGLATETRIKDAAGNVKAKSQIGYDESAVIFAGTTTQWQDPQTNFRGNATTTRGWTDVAANQFIETHAQYDNFGNLRKAWDAKGNLSEVEYSSTYYYAYPTKTISPIPDPSGTTGANQAFETTTTFDFTTGKLISTTDANGQISQIEYNDALLRPTRVIAPNGHQTITEYGAGTSAATRFVKVKTQIDQTNWQEAISWYDGIGRVVKAQSVDSSGDVFTETEYDNMNRPKKATNPYRTGETKLWTESFYDDLSRITKIKTPDNAEVLTAYSLATTGVNIGTVVTVTDQAGKQRRSITNGLGQLTRVDEPNESNQLGAINAPNQYTTYSYDILNNLTTVSQGSQTRSFVYDSLLRLKQATNPESGTINYSYDANGNVTQKIDARSIQTNFTYDALNRVVQRRYAGELTGQTTPTVNYFYDNLQNAKGKLIKVSSDISTTEYTSFDILGRVLAHKQTTDGNAYTTSYVYNLSGALTEETYPSTRVVKNVLDNDGDLSIVQSKKNQSSGYFNYAKNFTYTSAGAVSSMQLGNGKWESTQFNPRLQPTQIALGTVQNGTDKLKLNYDYGTAQNNGNVQSQTITVPNANGQNGFTAIQTYTYDSLNRLKSAVENIGTTQTWKQTFTFDRYGNRNFDTANTTTLGSCPQAQCNPQIDTANNRFTTGQGYTFDLAGNVISDATGRSFVYDAENKQKSVTNTSGTIGTYLYDGTGKRVKKISATEETIFVYDAAGKLVAEYSNQISQTPQVSYLTNDTLGTPRINTDANGNVMARHDYLLFGEETFTVQRTQGLGYTTDNVRQKFVGYERDSETNLDYAKARYHNYNLGRFSGADPAGGNVQIPQSFNKYVYVQNNPLKFIDPNGEELVINGDNADDLVSELETTTGYNLTRCGAVDKKVGCNKIGQVIIDKSEKRKTGKGFSDKLAGKLKDVINLKNGNGKDVTVTLNTTKDNGSVLFDAYKTRTVDVGDLQKARESGGGVSFVAGQLGHVLEEYSQSDLLYGEGVNKFDAFGNPATHPQALAFESEVVSEIEGDTFAPRRGVFTNFQYIPISYDGKKNNITYQIELNQEKGKVIYNVKEIKKFVVPATPN